MSSASPQQSPGLRILTLNCWGLKFVSKHRHERMDAIARFLASTELNASPVPGSSASRNSSTSSLGGGSEPGHGDLETASSIRRHVGASQSAKVYDVVALQEVWVRSDGDRIARLAHQSGLIYSRWWHSGALGSGLMILSRYPILHSRMFSYSLNGKPMHVIEGDWFVGKGAASVVLDLASIGLGQAEVFSTHFYSAGDGFPDEWRRAHRISQAHELANLARDAAWMGRHVFVCGDLNSLPSSLVMRVLTGAGELRDSWDTMHPTFIAAPTDPVDAIQRNGVTCDSPINFYSAGKRLGAQAIREYGKRLDYILYRPPVNPDRPSLKCVACSVCLTEMLPSGVSYSDHFGVETSYILQQEEAHARLPPPVEPLSSNEMSKVKEALQRYRTFAAVESRRFLNYCGLALVLGLIVLPVASSFQPLGFLNWLFVWFGALSGAAAATMLYVGFLSGRVEQGVLANFIQEFESRIVERQMLAA